MGKKRRKSNRKNKTKKEDFGSCSFYCKDCDYEFDLKWETIWDIQEVTHGYVGFHTNDTYISCPKCEEIVDNNDYKESVEDEQLFKDTFQRHF